jgi:hypothetical protein
VPSCLIASAHLGMYLYLRRRTRPMLRPLLAGAIVVRGLTRLMIAAVSTRG